MPALVKFYNHSSDAVHFGCFGPEQGNFRQTLQLNGTHVAQFFPGLRALVAWEDFSFSFIKHFDQFDFRDGDRIRIIYTDGGFSPAQVAPGDQL